MLDETDFAIGAHLLVPGEAITVGMDAGDDVVEAIAVDVIDKHLGTTDAAAQGEGMLFPNWIAFERSRLLPPAVFIEKVLASISVDVAAANAVSETLPFGIVFRCYGMKFPGEIGMFPIRLCVSDAAAGTANDFGFAIAG